MGSRTCHGRSGHRSSACSSCTRPARRPRACPRSRKGAALVAAASRSATTWRTRCAAPRVDIGHAPVAGSCLPDCGRFAVPPSWTCSTHSSVLAVCRCAPGRCPTSGKRPARRLATIRVCQSQMEDRRISMGAVSSGPQHLTAGRDRRVQANRPSTGSAGGAGVRPRPSTARPSSAWRTVD